MNGYQLMANSYKQLLAREETAPEERKDLESHIKVFEFLASLTDAEKRIIFDSGAFNDVLKGYVSKAVDNITRDGNEPDSEDLKGIILREINCLLSEMSSDQAEQYYYR